MKSIQILLLFFVALFVFGCADDSVKLYDYQGNVTSKTISRRSINLDSAPVRKIYGRPERYIRYFDHTSGVDGLVKIADLRLPWVGKAPITYRLDTKLLSATKRVNGRNFPIGNVNPTGSNTGRYFYFLYDDSYLYKWDWEIAGNYFFNAQGEFLFSHPAEQKITFAPDDSYLIEDQGWDKNADTVTVTSLPSGLTLARIRSSGFEAYGNRFLFYTTPDDQSNLLDARFQTGQIRVVDLDTKEDSPVPPFDTEHWYKLDRIANNDLIVEESGTAEDEHQPIRTAIPIPKSIQAKVE